MKKKNLIADNLYFGLQDWVIESRLVSLEFSQFNNALLTDLIPFSLNKEHK